MRGRRRGNMVRYLQLGEEGRSTCRKWERWSEKRKEKRKERLLVEWKPFMPLELSLLSWVGGVRLRLQLQLQLALQSSSSRRRAFKHDARDRDESSFILGTRKLSCSSFQSSVLVV